MAPNSMDDEYQKLVDRLRAEPLDAATQRGIQSLWNELQAAVSNSQPRRVRECWRVEDDLMFDAGYQAWLATDGPEGRA